MGKLRQLKRNLRIDKVQLAEQTRFEQIKLVKEMCVKRATEDAGFAKDILAAVGKGLPPEVKKAAEESIAKDKAEKEAKQPLSKDDAAFILELENAVKQKDLAIEEKS